MRNYTQVEQILSSIPKTDHDRLWWDEIGDRFFWCSEYFGCGYEQYQELSFDPHVGFVRKTGTTNREWFPDVDSGYKKADLTFVRERLHKRIAEDYETQHREKFSLVTKELKAVVDASPPGKFSPDGGVEYRKALQDFAEMTEN